MTAQAILATKQTAMRAAGSRPTSRNATLLVESAYCRRQNALIDYVMNPHSAESALGDFAAAWNVWLTQNTEELSDDEKEDVFDPAAADVYGLGGSDTSDTLVEKDQLCWRCWRCGRGA